jgi:hypothetical protein
MQDFLDPKNILRFRKHLKQKNVLPLFFTLQHAHELVVSPSMMESVVNGHVLPNPTLILPVDSDIECTSSWVEPCHFLLMILPDCIEREGLSQE